MTDVDHLYLDRRQGARLARELADLPELVADLAVTLTRQDCVRPRALGGRRSKPEPRLPLHVGAEKATAELRSALVAAVRHVAETRALDYDGTDELVSIAGWLRRHIGDLAITEGAHEFADAVLAAIADCRRVIDLPADDDIVIDPQRVAEANRQVMTADQIGRISSLIGDAGKGLSRRRVHTLAGKGLISPAGIDGSTRFWRLGDVLAAHQALNEQQARRSA